MSDTMASCPFCGDAALVSKFDTHPEAYRVGCSDCDCELTWHHEDRGDAIAAWNRRAMGWRPIGEAPKDGTMMLGYADYVRGKRVVFMSWIESGGCWAAMGLLVEPTHFMPLPAAPEAKP